MRPTFTARHAREASQRSATYRLCSCPRMHGRRTRVRWAFRALQLAENAAACPDARRWHAWCQGTQCPTQSTAEAGRGASSLVAPSTRRGTRSTSLRARGGHGPSRKHDIEHAAPLVTPTPTSREDACPATCGSTSAELRGFIRTVGFGRHWSMHGSREPQLLLVPASQSRTPERHCGRSIAQATDGRGTYLLNHTLDARRKL